MPGRNDYKEKFAERNERIRKEYNTGDSAGDVAKRLGGGLTRSVVIKVWWRAGLKRSPGGGEGKVNVPGVNLGHYAKVLPPPILEPSQAMINLAKHDPVIDRALRQRRGEPIEPIDLRYHKQPPLAIKGRG